MRNHRKLMRATESETIPPVSLNELALQIEQSRALAADVMQLARELEKCADEAEAYLRIYTYESRSN